MQPSQRNTVLHCETMQVNGGYGYIIKRGTDTLIYQPFIPAIAREIPFNYEEDARKVGQLVCDKLINGEMPGMTAEEMAKLCIR